MLAKSCQLFFMVISLCPDNDNILKYIFLMIRIEKILLIHLKFLIITLIYLIKYNNY